MIKVITLCDLWDRPYRQEPIKIPTGTVGEVIDLYEDGMNDKPDGCAWIALVEFDINDGILIPVSLTDGSVGEYRK